MNAEATATNINEAIGWLQQTGTQAQNFAIEQAPLYCREVVAWEFYSGTLGIIGSLVIITTGFVILRKGLTLIKEGKGKSYFERPDPFGWMLIAIILLVIGMMMITGSSIKATKACVAPRLVIVEHLRGLTK